MTIGNDPNAAQRVGLCIDCNYPLHGLATRRCPECGRAFDPEQPVTMNMGRAVGPLRRRLLRPVGWFTLITAIISTAAMLSVTRLPLGRPMNEARYYLRLAYWKTPDPARGWHEWAYLAGLLLTAWVAAAFVFRVTARSVLLRVHRRPRPRQGMWRQLLIVAAVVINGIAILTGWPYRTGRLWVARETAAYSAAVASPTPPVLWMFHPIEPPFPLSDADAIQALFSAATWMREPRARLTAVQLLACRYQKEAPAALVRLIESESDGDVCAAEIHLYTMLERNAALPLLDRYFTDPRPQVRAASADGIGVLSAIAPQRSDIDRMFNINTAELELDGRPPALVVTAGSWTGLTSVPLTSERRAVLEKMMKTGNDTVEREAAARVLRPWPPAGYSLRVAEWGVWVSDRGELKLIRSVLDEIPSFVHQTGNTIAEFNDRINPIMDVTKPIIHVTSNVLMSVDLAVVIRAGRPWYAYPLSDDFAVSVDLFDDGQNPRSVPLAPLDKPAIHRLADIREGYPWLVPHHRSYGTTGTGPAWSPHNELVGLGLRWQSLIVSPERLPWMQPPVVPKDPRYAWWERLRSVPSSWVSSRGEADRFLYYDGPTLAKPPIVAALNGTLLQLKQEWPESEAGQQGHGRRSSGNSPGELAFDLPGTFVGLAQSSPGYRKRRGLFIRVSRGRVIGREISVSDDATLPTTGAGDLQGPAVEALFRTMLRDRGLTEEEAGGLVAAWETQFFHKDGQRFLLLMSPADYDTYCPIQVRPAPTALVRVGIVLTEF